MGVGLQDPVLPGLDEETAEVERHAQMAAGHVDVAEQRVEHLQRHQVLAAVLVGDGAAVVVDRRGPEWVLLALEHDRLADPGGLTQFLREASHGCRGDGADLFHALGGVVGDDVAEELEAGGAADAVHVVPALKGEFGDLGVVPFPRLAGHGIPDHRLAIGAECVRAVGPDQVRGVRAQLQELPVVELVLEDDAVHQAEGERAVRAGADRHPLVSLRRSRRHAGLDGDDPHPAHPRVGHPLRRAGQVQVAREAVSGADLDPVVAVLVVVDDREARVGDAVDRVVGRAAVLADGAEEVGRAERGRPRPVEDAVEVAARHQELGRVGLADGLELFGDKAHRLVPGDLLPARIDARALLRICPHHWGLDPLGVVQAQHACVPLRAELAHVVGVRRVTLDLS